MRVMIFLGADLGDSSNGDISVASRMHNTHVHGRGREIPPWILGNEYGKQTSLRVTAATLAVTVNFLVALTTGGEHAVGRVGARADAASEIPTKPVAKAGFRSLNVIFAMMM